MRLPHLKSRYPSDVAMPPMVPSTPTQNCLQPLIGYQSAFKTVNAFSSQCRPFEATPQVHRGCLSLITVDFGSFTGPLPRPSVPTYDFEPSAAAAVATTQSRQFFFSFPLTLCCVLLGLVHKLNQFASRQHKCFSFDGLRSRWGCASPNNFF